MMDYFAYSQYLGRSFPHPPCFVATPIRVADLLHFNADPDPAFDFNADSDPDPHLGDENL
jgi:hypothetical protein